MRENNNSKKYNRGIVKSIHIIILLALIIILSIGVTSQAAEMQIDVRETINEETNFDISVYDPSLPVGSDYLDDVTISFNGKSYEIEPGMDSVTIKSPKVERDTQYLIIAKKDGYSDSQTTITVIDKPALIITPEKYTVNPNDRFAVRITDEDGNPVEGVTVAIQSYGTSQITPSDGYVWLQSPDDREHITITATKTGYEQESIQIGINLNPSIIDIILQSQYTPVFIAVFILIIIILIVNLRKRKLVDNRSREITKEKTIKKYSSHGAIITPKKTEDENGDFKLIPEKNGPKIEEIRISRPKKDKEIFALETDKKEEKKVMPVQSNKETDENDWFEGKDDLKYEIDKITGEVDEEGLDKWFEGTGDLKDKIDEKVKKKPKKEEEEDK